MLSFSRGLSVAAAAAVSVVACGAVVASADAAPAPAWTVTSVAGPTNFAPNDSSGNDVYVVRATNLGGVATDGTPITLTDTLPPGITLNPTGGPFGGLVGKDDSEGELSCSPGPPITCTDGGIQQPDQSVTMYVPVDVAPGTATPVTNEVSVSGGGAPSASATESTPVTSEPAGFGFQSAYGSLLDAAGAPATQAGSHPYQMITSFEFNTQIAHSAFGAPDGGLRDATVNLPAGLVVNPTATPVKCTEAELETAGTGCPAASAVGVVRTTIGASETRTGSLEPLFNMVPPPGTPADLAFNAAGLGLFVHLRGGIRTGGDYGLTATAHDVTQFGEIVGFSAYLWGNPSDPSHDATRGICATPRGGSCPVTPTSTPFLTLPSACSGPLTTTITADSWQNPGKFIAPDSFPTVDLNGNPVGVSGCEKLDFSPQITAKPDTSAAEAPSGLSVDIKVPQEESLSGLAEASLRDATVTLPAGMAVSPSAANGLGACSPEQIGLNNANAASCPDSSKLGEAEIITPLLAQPLKGAVYLAQQGTNPFGSLLALYLVAEGSGALIKLAGHVEADSITGQLTTTFQTNPQLPFNELKLKFFGGPRAPLITPAGCGTYETKSALAPWSGTAAATPSDTFSINTGCGGGFTPAFSAGAANNQAAGFSAFSTTFSRQDAEQRLGSVRLQLPPGLLGVLRSVPRCPEPQASQGNCGPEALIGHTTVGAGPGPDPFYIGGNVFLTGPYNGAPFGLSIVTHVLAGPFDLGNVIVRATVTVDPHTAQITATTDPLPTILQGIPLDLRTVNVTIDRSGFMFNPTSCSPLSVTGTIGSTGGASAGVSSPFEAANCANLPFKPSFAASTQGHTSKANGASLTVKIAQKPGEANIHKVNLQLPISLPSRLTTLQKACTASQFESNPAGCPEGSFVGTATAHTPLVAVPLTGPAILVSHGGAAFPDVVFVLQGEGIRIDLVGNTDIKKGITFSRFETVPDAPISSFETSLPEGSHSVLATNLPASAKYNFCGQTLTMPTTITGQNGAQVTQSTNIAVTGCGKPSIKITKTKIEGNTVLVTVTTTQQGTVTVSGNGLKTIKKTLGAGAHQLKVSLTKNGRTARKHHKKTTVKASVKDSNGSSSKTMNLKL
jgi:hypothetical protein